MLKKLLDKASPAPLAPYIGGGPVFIFTQDRYDKDGTVTDPCGNVIYHFEREKRGSGGSVSALLSAVYLSNPDFYIYDMNRMLVAKFVWHCESAKTTVEGPRIGPSVKLYKGLVVPEQDMFGKDKKTYTFQLEGRHLAWEFLEKDEVLDLKDLSALEQGKSVDTSIRANCPPPCNSTRLSLQAQAYSSLIYVLHRKREILIKDAINGGVLDAVGAVAGA